MVNFICVLALLTRTFIELVIIVGPLSIGCLILLLKKLEKDNTDPIRCE